jgi:molybdenum cofactor cytidylyltransferase
MSRAFAIVPAAGHSVRMGQPKLLLPLEGRPLIAHTLDAWRRSGVERIVVVVRADDAALAAAVQSLLVSEVDIVQPPIPPPDMKASIQAALRHILAACSPAPDDCFFVAPADMPLLSPAIIRALRNEYIREPGRIVVPVAGGRRGHPVLFPWALAASVHQLRPEEGLDALVKRDSIAEVACEHLFVKNQRPFADIDTPEEYRRLAGE